MLDASDCQNPQFRAKRPASEAAKQLETAEILVLPVRPPTVAKGTSRLRVTVSSEHTEEEVQLLIESLVKIVREKS